MSLMRPYDIFQGSSVHSILDGTNFSQIDYAYSDTPGISVRILKVISEGDWCLLKVRVETWVTTGEKIVRVRRRAPQFSESDLIVVLNIVESLSSQAPYGIGVSLL